MTTHLLLESMTAADFLRDTPILILGVLEICLAAAYLAFWRAASDYRVFGTMGIYFVVAACQQFNRYFLGIQHDWVFAVFLSLFSVYTAADALQIKHRRLSHLMLPVAALAVIFCWQPSMAPFREIPVDLSELIIIWYIIAALRHGNPRLRSIALGFILFVAVRLTISDQFRHVLSISRWVEIAGWRWYITTPTVVFLGLITLFVYVRELLADRREKQRLDSERQAARSVQQLLVPHQLPNLPDFRIQASFHPFGEVGGDFFQLLPQPNNSLLIAIGDVSGKGLKAAMTGTLAIGILRALSAENISPAQLLTRLNSQLSATPDGGFTTCLILHITPSGTATVANAGHIPPYLNGQELELPPSLPLGIAPDITYTQSHFSLSPGTQLTLMTDGIPEAQNQSALFGFDRTAAISSQSAQSIATAAQQWGQSDDITVLTLTRTT